MKFISFEKFEKWLNDNGFERDVTKDIQFFEPLWMKRMVYTKAGTKEYYIVDAFAKIHTKPLVLSGNIDKIMHGMNVDTIPSMTTIDARYVKIDFRKKFWREMINKDNK